MPRASSSILRWSLAERDAPLATLLRQVFVDFGITRSLATVACQRGDFKYGPFQPKRLMKSFTRFSRSSSGTISSLFSTSQRGLSYSDSSYFLNSLTMALASLTGSTPSNGARSTICNNKRRALQMAQELMPRPAPSAAPSIKPGISAMTKLFSCRHAPRPGWDAAW
jgi:hypothetical protein